VEREDGLLPRSERRDDALGLGAGPAAGEDVVVELLVLRAEGLALLRLLPAEEGGDDEVAARRTSARADSASTRRASCFSWSSSLSLEGAASPSRHP
jgi:hypothetical protein